MPRAAKINSNDRAAAWLSLYPYTPAKPTSRPQCNPAILARIAALRFTLAEMKQTMDVRKQILSMHANFSHGACYCAACSPSHQLPGSCGATCPLLRPRDRPHTLHLPGEYIACAAATARVYRGLADALEVCGLNVRIARLREWEVAVESLRRDCMTLTERYAEDHGELPLKLGQGVFKEGWAFEERWGMEPGMEVRIDPRVKV